VGRQRIGERRRRRATSNLNHSTVLKFFRRNVTQAIALSLALGEANANADFLLFLGCGQCVPKFKPEPEPEHARATAVNFAAEYKRPETKPVKTADTPRKQKATINSLEPLARVAEFPHDNLSIH
jgi:hypothetical protein